MFVYERYSQCRLRQLLRSRHRDRLLILLLAFVATGAPAAEVYLGHPSIGAHRVDICLQWGMQCAGEAAQTWCKAQGYDRAVEWEIDHDIGATHPTMVIGSGQICDQAHCDGYLAVICALEDAWTTATGNGGIVVAVDRESKQSPEGILVIAVSEQDVHQASAALVGVNGLALLHAPPGPWRLYAVNHGNSQQIRALPGFVADVPAGRDGAYVTILVD